MSVDVVERVKMALAEAGYPDAEVQPYPDSYESGVMIWPSQVPPRIALRARATAGIANLPCVACHVALNDQNLASTPPQDRPWDCLARGEGVEDCGVERSAS